LGRHPAFNCAGRQFRGETILCVHAYGSDSCHGGREYAFLLGRFAAPCVRRNAIHGKGSLRPSLRRCPSRERAHFDSRQHFASGNLSPWTFSSGSGVDPGARSRSSQSVFRPGELCSASSPVVGRAGRVHAAVHCRGQPLARLHRKDGMPQNVGRKHPND